MKHNELILQSKIKSHSKTNFGIIYPGRHESICILILYYFPKIQVSNVQFCDSLKHFFCLIFLCFDPVQNFSQCFLIRHGKATVWLTAWIACEFFSSANRACSELSVYALKSIVNFDQINSSLTLSDLFSHPNNQHSSKMSISFIFLIILHE